MFQAILGVLSSPPESDMYLRDEEGSGSGYPTDKSRYPDDDEETYGDGEGSGSGYSEIGKTKITFKLLFLFPFQLSTLPIILYGHETWSLNLLYGMKLRVQQQGFKSDRCILTWRIWGGGSGGWRQ